jgi:Serine aminopeptidase, S33
MTDASRNWLVRSRQYTALLILTAHSLLAPTVAAAQPRIISPTELESTAICNRKAWIFTEKGILNSWAKTANKNTSPKTRDSLSDLETGGISSPYQIYSSDGRLIAGRKLGYSKIKPNTAVLVAAGNISTADTMAMTMLPVIRATGYDFYFVDYRGYGMSQPANPSFKAFISDMSAVHQNIVSLGYTRVIAYGPSLGGIVLLNSAAAGRPFDRLIVDSVPSRLEEMDCDDTVHPIAVIKHSCPNISVIMADKDQVFSSRRRDELRALTSHSACGGKIISLHISDHALNDEPDSSGFRERVEALITEMKR